MPIPDFTPQGVLPEGVHHCTFQEVQARFACNQHRAALFGKLTNYHSWMRSFNVYPALYIDGSFVTDKPHPGDIDLIVELPDNLKLLEGDPQRALDNDFLKQNFGLDVYPHHPMVGNDFTLFFQYLRDHEASRRGLPVGSKKGLLRVAL